MVWILVFAQLIEKGVQPAIVGGLRRLEGCLRQCRSHCSMAALILGIGLPHQIVALFKALYTDTVSCVRADGSESEWFPVFSGVRQGCVVAPDAFLVPMDWLLEHTVHRGLVGTSVGKEIFTDLDFADDVALLAEMLSVLVLALKVMNEEAKPLLTGQRPRPRPLTLLYPLAH